MEADLQEAFLHSGSYFILNVTKVPSIFAFPAQDLIMELSKKKSGPLWGQDISLELLEDKEMEVTLIIFPIDSRGEQHRL